MFVIFLIFPVILLSQETFMLPDEGTKLINTLSSHIKTAKKEIHIFTHTINANTVVNSLKKVAKKDVDVFIITEDSLRNNKENPQQPNRASQLSLFQNISVFTLQSLRHRLDESNGLQGSLICIDDEDLFLLTHELDTMKLKQDYAFALHQKTRCKHLFKPLLERAKAY